MGDLRPIPLAEQRWFGWKVWEHDAERRRIGGFEGNSVKTVGQVDFNAVNWPIVTGCMVNPVQYSVEGVTELHGVDGGKWKCIGIDPGERIIDDNPVPAVALWDNPHG